MIRCIEVALSIPDNEARTALAVLQRLGIDVATLVRADLYRCDVDDACAEKLPDDLRSFETIFNPNKHIMRIREGVSPLAGEVWVDEIGHAAVPGEQGVRIAGRTLEGVRSFERSTAWRLFSPAGVPAAPEMVDAATDTLLCNAAFQKATR